MARIRLFTASVLFVVAAVAGAQPKVLVFQRKAPFEPSNDPNVGVATEVAAELERDGRVSPIVWSQTDPLFRSIIKQGQIDCDPDNPSDADILRNAAKLKVEYVLLVAAWKEEDNLVGESRLFRSSSDKAIWTDRKNMKVTLSSRPDWNETATALARTWTVLLANAPFKKLKQQPKVIDRTPLPQRNTDRPSLPNLPDSAIEGAKKALSEGKLSDAISIFREAVDNRPTDLNRRELLIQAYLRAGMDNLAAQEANSAAGLAADRVDFHLLAARCLLAVHDLESAQKSLNEALARDAQNPKVMLVLGQVHLHGGNAESALEVLLKITDKDAGAEVLTFRALANAMLGQADETEKDLKAAPLGTVEERTAWLDMARAMIMPKAEQIAMTLRQVIQACRVNPKDPNSIEQIEAASRLASGISAFFSNFPGVPAHKGSSDRMALALNLLSQACDEAADFAKTDNKDAGGEATLGLGEAMKQLASSRQQYESERSGS